MAKEKYTNRSEAELATVLKEKRNLLRDFRFRISKGKVKNIKEGRELKKQIARIQTELTKSQVAK